MRTMERVHVRQQIGYFERLIEPTKKIYYFARLPNRRTAEKCIFIYLNWRIGLTITRNLHLDVAVNQNIKVFTVDMDRYLHVLMFLERTTWRSTTSILFFRSLFVVLCFFSYITIGKILIQ